MDSNQRQRYPAETKLQKQDNVEGVTIDQSMESRALPRIKGIPYV